MNNYLINQFSETYEKDVNDASMFINGKSNYEDSVVEI